MKVRITIAGCVMVALVVGAFVIAAMQPKRTPIEELRRYFESVPDSLGWTINSRSDWDQRWSDMRGEMPMIEIWLEKLPWNGPLRDSGSYNFRKGNDYVQADAYFRNEDIDRVKIYGEGPPNLLALELQKDLRKRFPHMRVDILPFSN